ncbi:aldehyde dehydrogenase family protein [Kutzneria sp. NPDC052558]|uniref:aldehyde dehydrogenase family protein n=1 Tax=Kutzneria sp. NPDC052558 TaxID=3364121 RepID=UPI0037CA5DE6
MTDIALNWIGGEWLAARTVGTSTNPATGEVVGRFADGGAAEADAGIAAARRAFRETSWSRDRQLRHRVLSELADRFDARAEVLAASLTRENGKTLHEAGLELGLVSATLRHSAGQALTAAGVAAEALPGVFFSQLAEPVGVISVIVPWNAPIALFVRSLGPALAAGNAVVAKLPAQTALTNALVSEVIASVEALPKGIVNVFTETGNTGAPRLVDAPGVDVVSYTGSVEVGRRVGAAAGAALKRVNLELGGKSPMIVFDDADLARTLPLLVQGLIVTAGQFCMAGTRILVQRGIADTVREQLAAALSQVVVGPGDDPASQMGPLIDAASADRVEAFVEAALAYAKPVVRGGRVVDRPGAFYRPSLLEVEDLDVPLVQEEIFGPVGTFEVFEDEVDAVRRANGTQFGLAAAVFTRDGNRARKVSRELAAGTVWTNGYFALDDGFAEGGYKSSGVGRLRGPLGLAEFQEAKTYVEVTG